MEKDLGSRIDYFESPAFDIARTLRERGYEIASSLGIRQTEPNLNVIGILKPRAPVQKSLLGFKWTKERRALYIGKLWLNSRIIGARYGENWVLDVFGRDNVSELTEIVREFSEPRGVDVKIRLSSEGPLVEGYDSDYTL